MLQDGNSASARIVVFLGAGASAFAGYRTYQTFGDLLLDPTARSRESGLPPIRDTTPPLLEQVGRSLGFQNRPVTHDNYLWMLQNYLNFCEIYEREESIQSRLPHAQDLWATVGPFRRVVENTIHDITKTTLHHYSKNRVAARQAQNPEIFRMAQNLGGFYSELAMLNDQETPCLPVFTTNYDLLLEDVFQDRDIVPNPIVFVNGIDGIISEGAVWKPEMYKSGKCPGIRLFRLHGCVCWTYQQYEDPRVYLHRNDILQQSLNSLCVMIPGREIYRGKPPHAFGFRQLYAYLEQCMVVLFIGFSFRDDDVMHVLLAANASRRRMPLKIVIVDPVMNPDRVMECLDGASTRSPFPVSLPSREDIEHLEVRFGEGHSFDMIMRTLHRRIQDVSAETGCHHD